MRLLILYLAVAGASALGGVMRLAIASACGRWFKTSFPVGTFIINIGGSLLLGWFITVVGQRMAVSEPTRLAVAVGFIGAFTTFSTFMYESNALFESGSEIKAMANLVGSVVIGLAALRAGIWLGGH